MTGPDGEGVLWERATSEHRWLRVFHPDREGYVSVDVHANYVTPREAVELATALLNAAAEGRKVKAARAREYKRRAEARAECARLGAHDHAPGTWACRRCGDGPQTAGGPMVVETLALQPGEFLIAPTYDYRETGEGWGYKTYRPA